MPWIAFAIKILLQWGLAVGGGCSVAKLHIRSRILGISERRIVSFVLRSIVVFLREKGIPCVGAVG